MIRNHRCKHCKTKGKIWLPYDAKNTIVKCPVCKKREDVAYLLETYKSVEDYEREEYERLKKKYK